MTIGSVNTAPRTSQEVMRVHKYAKPLDGRENTARATRLMQLKDLSSRRRVSQGRILGNHQNATVPTWSLSVLLSVTAG